MSSTLNADILSIIASFLQRDELLRFSLASQAHRTAAYPCLYTNVHVESLAGLRAFAETIRRNPYLAPCVKHFTEGVSRWRPLYAGVGPAQWREYTSTVLEMLQALRLMTHVALSASLDFCTEEDVAACHPKTLVALGNLTHLTALALTDVDYHFLDLVDVCAPLTILHVSPSHTQWTGSHEAHDRDEWMVKLYRIIERRHAQTLVELNVPYGSVIERPEFAHVCMPNVETFMVPEGLSATPQLAAMFPNLRHLRLGVGPHALRGVDKVWPRLAHLELESCEPGLVGPEHEIRSLSFCVDRADFRKFVPSLASRRVESLRLRWEEKPPEMRDVVAQCFPAVRYMELPVRLEAITKVMDPSAPFDMNDHWPADVPVEVFNFFIMVLPPPPVGWDADVPLKHILTKVYDSVKLIILSWIDADFTPHARMLARDASGTFMPISMNDAFAIVSKYRYAPLWPRWSASSFCTEFIH
ncbi:hypothetical protein AURDEDRAFT_162383 [Auricularia subglabra TFB-10046 SS5]|nr:hypothetical protein AURDEDRAFT_162383 [Auricularia subglabra TFB-10046 SS5]